MRRVLVYAPRVLPRSQTFVADQVRFLDRWKPVLVGRSRIASGLDVQDLVPSYVPEDTWRLAPTKLLQRVRRANQVLPAAVGSDHFDLLHAHFLTGGFDVVASLRPLPCPVVVTAHGFDATWFGSPRNTLRPDRWYHGWLRRRLLREPIHFIAVSGFIRDELVRLGAPPERVVVHHTGIDTSFFQPPSHADQPREGILVVARLVPKKGILDLIDAVTRLSTMGLPVPVRIIGEGPLRSRLERTIRRRRLDVTFLGSRARSDVLREMQRAAVLCAPSRTAPSGDREGFGMVLAEAQATGTCVVATRSGGIVDAVADGRTGILVPEGDPEALAGALRRCLDDEDLRARLGEAGRDRVRQHFDVRRQTKALEDLYDAWTRRG